MSNRLKTINSLIFRQYQQKPLRSPAQMFSFDEKGLMEKYGEAEDYEKVKSKSSTGIIINVATDQNNEKGLINLLCQQIDRLNTKLQKVTNRLENTLDYLDSLDKGDEVK
ncbi:MAG: hypothetical protein HQ568_05135 [Calditrichaeota bacterium]|nr:hypothetical protein [Calditrichota bacterium]